MQKNKYRMRSYGRHAISRARLSLHRAVVSLPAHRLGRQPRNYRLSLGNLIALANRNNPLPDPGPIETYDLELKAMLESLGHPVKLLKK